MIITLFSVVIAIVLIFVTYFKWRYNYWEQQGVPFPQPTIPLGNIGNQAKKKQHICMDVDAIYKQMKAKGHSYTGIYMFDAPIFVPIDVNLVKNILTTDFSHFVNHGVYYNETVDPISAHIFALENDRWRNIRSCIKPAFSIGRGKIVYDALSKWGVLLKEEVIKLTKENKPIDIKDLSQRYIIDSIGDYNFGIECNSMKNPDAEFKVFCYKCFQTSFNIWMIITMLYPKFSKLVGLRAIQKDVGDFFTNALKSTIEYRDANNVKRNDIINLLMSFRKKSENISQYSLSLNDIVAQAFLFFQAGYETSSATINYCFYELGKNQNVQDKVREEILRVLNKYNNELSYEALSEMKYLEMTIQETLRKYPPSPLLLRVCNKDYKVPNSDFIIKEGTKLFIPVYSLHFDPDYYPDPEKFDPERFSDENKSDQFTYLPFGEGPRICIGLKFGLIHVKMAVITIIKEVKVRLNSKTPQKITFNPNGFTSNTQDDLFLDTELLK